MHPVVLSVTITTYPWSVTVAKELSCPIHLQNCNLYYKTASAFSLSTTTFVKKRPLLQKGIYFMIKLCIVIFEKRFLKKRAKGEKNMNKPCSKKLLTAAVLCSLLTASPVWAVSQTAIQTVTTGNMESEPYSKIDVTGTASELVTSGILHKQDGTAMTVYMDQGSTITVNSLPAAGSTNRPVNANGIRQEVTTDTAMTKLTVSGDTTLNITTTPGNYTANGNPQVLAFFDNSAVGVYNKLDPAKQFARNKAVMELDAVRGNVTLTGGVSSSTNNFIRNKVVGIQNQGVLEADSVNLTLKAGSATSVSGLSALETYIFGINTSGAGGSSVTVKNATVLNITATGAQSQDEGKVYHDFNEVRGLNVGSGSKMNLQDVKVTANLTGGTVNENRAGSESRVIGSFCEGEMQAQNLEFNLINQGGTVNGGAVGGELNSYTWGIVQYPGSKLQIGGDTQLNVLSTAGTLTPGASVYSVGTSATGILVESSSGNKMQNLTATITADASNNVAVVGNDTTAYGLTINNGDLTTQAVNLNLTAKSGTSTKGYVRNIITGIRPRSATFNAQGDVIIKTHLDAKESASGWGENAAYVINARNSTVNLGTDGSASLKKIVQLEGIIMSMDGSQVNVNLDQADSYLQGNVYSTDITDYQDGTVNLLVANGATWRPVFDNRYGDFTEKKTINVPQFDGTTNAETYNSSYAPDYTVTTGGIKTLTLQDGGIVDLTWDNAANGKRSGVFRTLSIDTLKGDGGVFRINSDLAGSKADQIVLGQGTTTTATNVAVKYDPYLDTAGLKKGNGLSGNAVVFSGAGVGSLASVTGVQDSYNLYTYTPTFAKNADGTWSLTGLNIDKPLPPGPASGHVKSAGHDRVGLNSLFQFETNSLSRRLGELGDAASENTGAAKDVTGKTANATSGGDTTSGIWARYHDGKLEQGDASLKANLFQAGYDKRSDGKTEKTYRGAALSYAKGNGTYELGTGHVKETTLSLYQTGIKNDGRYYDVVLKAGKYMNDYDVTNTANPSSADYSTWAYSISGEVGKRFDLGKGLYVEPQAEMILSRLNGADYTTSTDMNVNVDAQNKAITRLGLAFGKSYSRGSLYGKFSYYHDFGSGINLNAAANGASAGYSEDLAKNWTELTIGGSAKLGKNANAYAEVSKYMGQLTSNVRYNIGARWSF